MGKLGRNDRCHCGSGKKYKTCCLAADQHLERVERARGELLREILSWLAQRQEDFFSQAMQDLLGEHHLQLAQGLEAELGPDPMREHWIEWALSEAVVQAGEVRVTALQLLAEGGAPSLEGDAGAYVSALLRAPLQAWSVESCTFTVTLRNLVTAQLVELDEPGLSGFLVEGDVIGLRVFEWDGRWHRYWAPWFCSDYLEESLQELPAGSDLARHIAEHWLREALETLDDDDALGELRRTRYHVHDRDAMTTRLREAGAEIAGDSLFLFVDTAEFSAEINLFGSDLIVTTSSEPEADLADAYVQTNWGPLVELVERTLDPLDDALPFDDDEPERR
jgi:hypothetical protein